MYYWKGQKSRGIKQRKRKAGKLVVNKPADCVSAGGFLTIRCWGLRHHGPFFVGESLVAFDKGQRTFVPHRIVVVSCY